MAETPVYPIKWITPVIATGYAPTSHDDLDEIRRQGISVIVNMCAECYDLADIEAQAGFDVYRLFVHDMEAPDAEALDRAITWFEGHMTAGRRGLIHCRYGLGRTGTFALAYLIHTGNDLQSAITKIQATPAMPQTRLQWDFIEQYAKAKNHRMVSALPKAEENGIHIFFKRQMDRLKWFR
jgi:protein-tyrosine phosphatase